MKIILLAAGRGSRLGDRTKDKPKCMCSLYGKTLLERALQTIEQAGFSRDQIGIVTGYRSEMIQAQGVHYFHNENWETTNMVVSLTKAAAWLRREPCLVCYSDIVFSPDAIRKLADAGDAVALTYYTGFWELWQKRMGNPLEDLETFRVDLNGTLLEIGQKPQSREDIQGQYMGLLRFTPQGWKQVEKTFQTALPKPLEKLDMTSLLQAMLVQGVAIKAIPTDSLWLECDTEQDILVYERYFENFLK